MEELRQCQAGDHGDHEAESIRQRIVEVNMGLAKTLARRYYGRDERSEDLDQTAYLGLIAAVNRFDPDRGKDFLSFAVPTILGELRRHFRDGCWFVRPPRRVQELQGRMTPVMDAFVQDHGRTPDPEEIAERLDADVDDVVEALTAHGCFIPTPLDQPLTHESATTIGETIPQEEPDYDRVETHELLKPLIRELPEREHRVMELRFFRDRTQQQIADDLGVTQTQVSRILARIMERLRARLRRGGAFA